MGNKNSGIKFQLILRFLKRAAFWFLIVSVAWVLLYKFVNPPVTWLMVQRGVERKAEGKPWKLKKSWKDFDQVSVNLRFAAMAGEDARFLLHWGFDLKSIQKAYEKNKSGKPLRGGSTISQQTAKNVFLWPGRSWIRKGFEVYFTALIELIWGKRRILEVYLNVIETGDGLYGAEAASQVYYGKSASQLKKREAAMLIAILPNPRKWTPLKPTSYVYHKHKRILANMRRLKNLSFE